MTQENSNFAFPQWNATYRPKGEYDDMGYAFVRRHRNRIYLFGEINDDTIGKFCIALDKIIDDNRKESIEFERQGKEWENPSIQLYLNTPGGDVTSGLTGMNLIRLYQEQGWYFETFIMGDCSSAGTFISIVADKRWMSKYSTMLVHELSHIAMGRHTEMEEKIETNKKIMAQIKKLYLEYSKLTATELDKIIGTEIAWIANEAKKKGLVDQIF
jgi:ATP-dependent Clp protease protease subunit